MSKWKANGYESKYDNYDISQRLADLHSMVELQSLQIGYKPDEHMRGMANGLLLAWHIMREPYGAEVPYFEPLAKVNSEPYDPSGVSRDHR